MRTFWKDVIFRSFDSEHSGWVRLQCATDGPICSAGMPYRRCFPGNGRIRGPGWDQGNECVWMSEQEGSITLGKYCCSELPRGLKTMSTSGSLANVHECFFSVPKVTESIFPLTLTPVSPLPWRSCRIVILLRLWSGVDFGVKQSIFLTTK